MKKYTAVYCLENDEQLHKTGNNNSMAEIREEILPFMKSGLLEIVIAVDNVKKIAYIGQKKNGKYVWETFQALKKI